MLSTKGQDETLEKNPNKTEISDLPDKEFKIINIKNIQIWRKMHQQSENFKTQKDIENIFLSTRQKSQNGEIQLPN